MFFLLKPIELQYRTNRSKEVITRLNEIASFTADRFKLPINYSGNKLFKRSRLLSGEGIVTTDQNTTVINVTLRPAGQLKTFSVINTLISSLLIVASIILLFTNAEVAAVTGMLLCGVVFLSVPIILYFVAIQMRKDSIENLVL